MKNITTSTVSSNKRIFRRGKHNARAQTVRARCGLVGMLAVVALDFLTPRVAMGALSVDVGTYTLTGDSATPQTIYLSVNNSGSPITVGALNFYIQLGDGTGTTPYISSVDLLTGTIFASNNSGQSADSGNLPQNQFYGVLKASGPVGSGPVIPTGLSQLATISFVTTGTPSGTFSLSFGSTDYFTDTTSPVGVGLSFTPGELDLAAVPEPVNVALPIFGGLVALATGCSRWCRRKASVC